MPSCSGVSEELTWIVTLRLEVVGQDDVRDAAHGHAADLHLVAPHELAGFGEDQLVGGAAAAGEHEIGDDQHDDRRARRRRAAVRRRGVGPRARPAAAPRARRRRRRRTAGGLGG